MSPLVIIACAATGTILGHVLWEVRVSLRARWNAWRLDRWRRKHPARLGSAATLAATTYLFKQVYGQSALEAQRDALNSFAPVKKDTDKP